MHSKKARVLQAQGRGRRQTAEQSSLRSAGSGSVLVSKWGAITEAASQVFLGVKGADGCRCSAMPAAEVTTVVTF